MSKEMPRDLISERALLGCLVLDGSAFDEIMDLSLVQEDFFHPQYGIIFNAIRELHFASSPIDFVTLSAKLNDQGKIDQIGGQEALLALTEEQASSVNIYHYGKSIKDKAILRDIVKTAAQVMDEGMQFKGEMEEFINKVESKFFRLTSETKRGGLRNIKEFLAVNLRQLEDERRKKGEAQGLPTGFHDLDKKLMGLQPGQLVVLAARPAMGKTSLALNLAVNAASATGLPVAIYSLEMLAPELSMRVLSSEAGVDAGRLRSKSFLDTDLRNIAKAVQTLSDLPLVINDAADITLVDIRSQCRKIKTEQGLGLVIIDYLQLMQPHTATISREQQISEISRGLKNLAKELECPVIALSQLNRGVESRVDKRPMASDLRESGAIEQDADIILMVYRDEVYYKDSKDKGVAEVIVVKNRAGETGTSRLAWIGSQTKFANLEMSRSYNAEQ